MRGAHLVETLEQAHDAALDLVLAQGTASAVHADSNKALDLGDGGGARSSDGGDEGPAGSRSERDARGGG